MQKTCFSCLALLLLLAPHVIYAQNPDGSQASGGQSDCLMDPSGCSQGQSNAPTVPTYSYPVTPNLRTGASASENTPLSGQVSQGRREAAPLPPDPPTEFQKLVAATTGQLLPIYGVDLFRNVPSTFAPNDLAPVTSNYVIGPDDQLRVRIWGQVTYSGNLRVDRSGDIYLPQAGTVHVAGLSFSELDQHLRAAVAKNYRNFDLSVDIGQIRAIQIYVTGYGRRPGVYTVSALSSLVDALFASGGPSPQGSLRHIQLKREGKTIADFDLYALLLHGDKSHDIRLLPEDVIYIAPAGHQAAITGSIAIPGIYELLEGETVGELIESAGRTTALSSNARISLERVGPGQLREAMEFPLDPKGLASPLADTDVLRIYPILAAYQKTVILRGDVANPGRFNWHPGMHLSDLIPDKDSLESRDYWWRRSHLGLPSPEFEPLISSPESLPSALTATNHSGSWSDSEAAARNGNNTSIASQLPKTGSAAQQGPIDVHLANAEIDWDYAVIERLDPDSLRTSLIPFDLGKLVMNHDATQDLLLQPADTITVFSQGDIHVPLEQQTKYVDLEGEIVHAGIYSVQPGETLRDVIQRAGGFTSKAYLYGSEFNRESTRALQQQRFDEYVRNLSMESERGTQALAIAGSSSPTSANDVTAARVAGQDLVARLSQVRATGRIVLPLLPGMSSINDLPAISLENGDRFIVPAVPTAVNVVGAVYDQNSFLFRVKRPVSYYLKLAGGATRDADAHRAFIIRADGSVIGRNTVKNLGAWSKGFEDISLNAGDSIVVPEKTLRPTAMRTFIDTTQIFSQLALGAAAIHSF